MPRKALPTSVNKRHLTNDEKRTRKEIEENLKIGKIADYKPVGLSRQGNRVFKFLAESIPEDVLCEVDGYTIEVVADAIDNMRKCREMIKKDGLIIGDTDDLDTCNGNPHKAIGIYQKYSEIARKYLADLGLNPVARAKIANEALAKTKPKQITASSIFDDD